MGGIRDHGGIILWFKKQFNNRTVPITESGCLLWTGYCNEDGYGQVQYPMTFGRKKFYSHRLSWEMHYGKIPEGLCICHKCDIPSCVNPNHLFVGSRADNNKDMTKKGRLKSPIAKFQSSKSHCPKGHEYFGKNLMIRKSGHRQCRTCSLDRTRILRMRNKKISIQITSR